MMDFSEVFDTWQSSFVVLGKKTPGHYENGIWIPGDTERIPMTGMVMPLNNDDLKYDTNGTYTIHDKKVYVRTSLGIGAQIEFEGHAYTLQQGKNYSSIAGFWQYIAKRVSTHD